MKNIIEIETKSIKFDSYPLTIKTLDLAEKIREGLIDIKDLMPIKVKIDENGQYVIKDGRHRLLAFRLNEIEVVLSEVSEIIKSKNKPVKKKYGMKIANAVSLFESKTGVEAIKIKKHTNTFFEIKGKDNVDRIVDLSKSIVEEIYPDPE